MSRTRQVGPFGRVDLRKSGTEANSRASKPTDRRSRPTDSRNAGSSSITKTGGPVSDITSTRKAAELSTIYRRNKPLGRETGLNQSLATPGLPRRLSSRIQGLHTLARQRLKRPYRDGLTRCRRADWPKCH